MSKFSKQFTSLSVISTGGVFNSFEDANMLILDMSNPITVLSMLAHPTESRKIVLSFASVRGILGKTALTDICPAIIQPIPIPVIDQLNASNDKPMHPQKNMKAGNALISLGVPSVFASDGMPVIDRHQRAIAPVNNRKQTSRQRNEKRVRVVRILNQWAGRKLTGARAKSRIRCLCTRRNNAKGDFASLANKWNTGRIRSWHRCPPIRTEVSSRREPLQWLPGIFLPELYQNGG